MEQWPPSLGPRIESILKKSRLGGILGMHWKCSRGLVLRTALSSILRMRWTKANSSISLHRMLRGPRTLILPFLPSPESKPREPSRFLTIKLFENSLILRLDYDFAGV